MFDSLIKGSMRNNSNIDVLLVTKPARNSLYRGRLFRDIVSGIGLDNLFEIHMVYREKARGALQEIYRHVSGSDIEKLFYQNN